MWGDIQNIHCNYTVTPNLPVPTLHSNNARVSNVNGAALLISESNLPRMLLKQQKKSHQCWIQSDINVEQNFVTYDVIRHKIDF